MTKDERCAKVYRKLIEGFAPPLKDSEKQLSEIFKSLGVATKEPQAETPRELEQY